MYGKSEYGAKSLSGGDVHDIKIKPLTETTAAKFQLSKRKRFLMEQTKQPFMRDVECIWFTLETNLIKLILEQFYPTPKF